MKLAKNLVFYKNLYIYVYIFYRKNWDRLYNVYHFNIKTLYSLSQFFFYNNFLNIDYLLKRTMKKYNFNFLCLKTKKIKIIFFHRFLLRINLIYFLCLFDYINYFKIYKYKEYLSNHPLIGKYPLLLLILNLIKINNNLKFSGISILNNFQIFSEKLEKKNKKSNLNKKMTLLYKNNYIKYLLINYNNLYNFIYNFIKKSIYIYIYWFFYKIITYNYENFLEYKYLHISSLPNLYINIKKFNVKKTKLFFNLKLNNIIKKQISFSMNYNYKYGLIDQLWFSLIQIILIEYIDNLFFRFYNDLTFFKNNKNKKKIWIQCWIILKRAYIFWWIKFNNQYKSHKKALNNNIIWKVFYLNNYNFYNYFNCNIKHIINFNKIQKSLNNQYWLFNDFCILFLHIINNYKNYNYLLIKNIIIKIFMNFYNIIKIHKYFNYNIFYLDKIKQSNINNYIIIHKNTWVYYSNYKQINWKYYEYHYNIILIIIFFCSYLTKKSLI